jgi:nitroreductase
MTSSAFSLLARSRRSTKPVAMDPERPVSPELVISMLEDAAWAPTHGLTEPWRFRVFAGEARRTLAAELQRLYREITPAAEVREDKLEKLGASPLLASVSIVAWMHRDATAKIPEIEEIAAASAAIQNLLLAATAHGVASFWSSPPLIYHGRFNEWLGIPAGDRALGIIYLGWPKPGAPAPASTRKGIADRVSWA